MGVLQLGVFTFPIHFIPPGAESFMSYGLCKTEKFEEVKLEGVPPEPPLPLRFPVPSHRSGVIHQCAARVPRVEKDHCLVLWEIDLTWLVQGRRESGLWGRKRGQEAQQGLQGCVPVFRGRCQIVNERTRSRAEFLMRTRWSLSASDEQGSGARHPSLWLSAAHPPGRPRSAGGAVQVRKTQIRRAPFCIWK